MKNVCVVTGSRAEYGLMRPLLFRLRLNGDISLALVATGSHLMPELGNTIDELVQDGFTDTARIPIQEETGTKEGMAEATGGLVMAFAAYFAQNPPDLLVVLGDRFEIFAASVAAAMEKVPIAHIHGGETTEGAVDEFLRHSITKMSVLHFSASETYRRRTIQLGEAPDRVFNVGALGVENCMNVAVISRKELSEEIGFDILDHQYCVVTFHPSTLDAEGEAVKQLRELISAMEQMGHYRYIITKSNADAGGAAINSIWDEEGPKHINWFVTASLGFRKYLSAVRYAEMVLGNSSSGLLEAPALKVPTVNIGDRQRGRIAAESVLTCRPEKSDMIQAMKKAATEEFKQAIKTMTNPFGDGHTSERIAEKIVLFLKGGIPAGLKKRFYDVQFEISAGTVGS